MSKLFKDLKICSVAFTLFVFVGCTVPIIPINTGPTLHYNIGSTWSEFYYLNGERKINRLRLEKATQEIKIYRLGDRNYNPVFFYFKNDILVQVDNGVPAAGNYFFFK
jgi:hypothetical protein